MKVAKRIAFFAIYFFVGLLYFPLYFAKGINAANAFIESTLVKFQHWMD